MRRGLHHNAVNWSIFSRMGKRSSALLRNLRCSLNMSSETAGVLRYEFEMAWLNLCMALSPAYKRALRAAVAADDIRLNVGCGSDALDGWTNVDSFATSLTPRNMLLLDLRDNLPFRDGSVVCVYTEHFLEHLDRNDHGKKLLQEFHRILKPGGVVRVIVPDSRKMFEAYFDPNHPTRLAFPEHRNNWMDWINQVFNGGHKYMYDVDVLMADLKEAGFSEVYECQSGCGNHPEVLLDNQDQQRRAFSLYVEAVK